MIACIGCGSEMPSFYGTHTSNFLCNQFLRCLFCHIEASFVLHFMHLLHLYDASVCQLISQHAFNVPQITTQQSVLLFGSFVIKIFAHLFHVLVQSFISDIRKSYLFLLLLIIWDHMISSLHSLWEVFIYYVIWTTSCMFMHFLTSMLTNCLDHVWLWLKLYLINARNLTNNWKDVC